MHDRKEVISHLQIMHTWADFALKKGLNFFADKHLKDIAEWTTGALELLKEQEPVRCENCKHWVGGWIDDNDNFIPPRCKLFNEPHNADWFCPRWEGR